MKTKLMVVAVVGMTAAAAMICTHPKPGRSQQQYGFVIVDNGQESGNPVLLDENCMTLTGEWKSAFATQHRLAYGSHVTQRVSGQHDDSLLARILKKLRRPS